VPRPPGLLMRSKRAFVRPQNALHRRKAQTAARKPRRKKRIENLRLRLGVHTVSSDPVPSPGIVAAPSKGTL
jgi:hypothetical protein